MKKSCVRLLVLFTVLGCFWSSLSLVRPFHSFIDLSQSLGSYFLFGHVTSVVLLVVFTSIRKRTRLLLLFWNGLLLFRYLFFVFNWYFPPGLSPACSMVQAPQVSALFANVYSGNDNYEILREQIEAESPDYVALNEVTSEWVSGLALKDSFPYSLERARPGNFGIALYSKYPIQAVDEEEIGYGADVTPAIRAIVQAGPHAGLHIIVVHAMPPVAPTSFSMNKRLFRRIATEVRHLDQQAIVLGDFNATIFSGLFRTLFWGGELQHAGAGGPYFATWDVHSPVIALMLDHVLLTSCIERTRYERGSAYGSDHYPLYFAGRLGEKSN